MSTKIYDAYKLTVPDISKLFSFINRLKLECHEEAASQIYSQIAIRTTCLLDEGMLYKTHPKLASLLYTDWQKYILSLYRESHSGKRPDNRTDEELLENLSKYDYLTARYLSTETILARYESNHDISQNLVLFHKDGNHDEIYFIAFGKILTKLLYEIIDPENKDWQAFRAHYLLEDYHYQNQTDQPENISDEEWKQREEDWEELMPSFIPSQDGIVIHLYDIESLNCNGRFTFSDYDDLEAYLPSKTNRVHDLAVRLTNAEYITKDMAASDVMHIAKEIKTQINNQSGTKYNLYLTYKKILTETLPEIDQTYFQKSIYELL